MVTGPEILPGVRELEHTADIGMVVRAGDLPELFRRAARGMQRLIHADEAEGHAESVEVECRTIALSAGNLGDLLVAWLRELLYVAEVDGLVFVDGEFERLNEWGLRARVRFARATRPPIREVKGVTYHGLEVSAVQRGFRARVIFDV